MYEYDTQSSYTHTSHIVLSKIFALSYIPQLLALENEGERASFSLTVVEQCMHQTVREHEGTRIFAIDFQPLAQSSASPWIKCSQHFTCTVQK